MIIDADKIRTFETNNKVMEEYFPGKQANIHGTCFFKTKEHKFMIWFNYRAYNDAKGMLVKPLGGNDYNNIYNSTNTVIEQEIPKDKYKGIDCDCYKIVFAKESENIIYFTGVYKSRPEVFERRGYIVETLDRVSTLFDTENYDNFETLIKREIDYNTEYPETNFFYIPKTHDEFIEYFKKVGVGKTIELQYVDGMKEKDVVFVGDYNHNNANEKGIYIIAIIKKVINNLKIEATISSMNYYTNPIIKMQECLSFIHDMKYQQKIDKIDKKTRSNIIEMNEQFINPNRKIERSLLIEELEKIDDDTNIVGDEKEVIAKARINQNYFRTLLLHRKPECAICGIKNEKLLVASHIKEWKYSNNQEKVDRNNGLLLCAMHDKLFDKHLISFDKEGKILISDEVKEEIEKIPHIEGVQIDISPAMERYMSFHRKAFSENNKNKTN